VLASARGAASLWRRRREPIEPRRPVPWNGLHVLAIVAVSIVLQGMLPHAFGFQRHRKDDSAEAHDAESDVDPAQARAILLGTATANLLTVALAVAALHYGLGASAADLGFDTAHLAADVRLGLTAFAALLIPIYAIQLVLTHWFKGEHPIERWIRAAPEPGLIAAAAITAVVVAPLAEEFIFRVLLQGWLERRWPPMPVDESLDGIAPIDPSPPAIRLEPIAISAAIFALLHLGWPGDLRSDPIPLFVLAVMLGYLYQRTHRIWPSIVVHACLNAASMAALAASVLAGAE
jgi:membrane protease YdiL (CAAX protease family)